jgi:hypothetical protein
VERSTAQCSQCLFLITSTIISHLPLHPLTSLYVCMDSPAFKSVCLMSLPLSPPLPFLRSHFTTQLHAPYSHSLSVGASRSPNSPLTLRFLRISSFTAPNSPGFQLRTLPCEAGIGMCHKKLCIVIYPPTRDPDFDKPSTILVPSSMFQVWIPTALLSPHVLPYLPFSLSPSFKDNDIDSYYKRSGVR